ncbi:efflux RND transporter periplasmic adaptor subunit [Polystyrenella longa]|nr:HlyD family efflux transporter periplasmic adaptor subunit [Polystyrenella longa]
MGNEKITKKQNFKSKLPMVMVSVIAVLLLTGTVFGFLYLKSLKKSPESRDARELVYKVTVYDANPSQVQRIITGFGTAKADREVVVSAQVAGEVVQTNPRLEVGEKMIAHGESERIPPDLLIRIDPTTYQQKVSQANSMLASDRAELARLNKEEINQREVLDKAEADLKVYREQFQRVQGLKTRGVASSSELDQAQLELQRYETVLLRAENENKLYPLQREKLERQIENHEQDLQLAEHNLRRTEVNPPFNAVVSEVSVELGEYVNVGKELLKMVDLSLVEVPVSITMKDYAFLKAQLDDKVYPLVELAENETASSRWYGNIVRLSPVMNEQTRTVKVFVQVNNREQTAPLLPGTFVHARIEGDILEDVLIVPRDAIQNGQIFVASSEPVPRPKSPTDRDEDDKESAKQDEAKGTKGNQADTLTEDTATDKVAKDDRPPVYAVEARSVEVEQTLQSLAVISAGVNPGEVVVMSNLDVIHDGAKIEVYTRRNLTEEIKSQRVRVARKVQTAKSKLPPVDQPMESSLNSPTSAPR